MPHLYTVSGALVLHGINVLTKHMHYAAKSIETVRLQYNVKQDFLALIINEADPQVLVLHRGNAKGNCL